jgi:hypothetical protein
LFTFCCVCVDCCVAVLELCLGWGFWKKPNNLFRDSLRKSVYILQ